MEAKSIGYIILVQALTVYVKDAQGDILAENMVAWTGRKLLNTSNSDTTPEPPKSIWQQIEDFYADKNNFAMYLVLPAIVLVYGGCAMIYCVAKCRQYIKGKRNKKKKRLKDIDDDDTDDIITQNNNNNAFQKLQKPDADATDVKKAAIASQAHQRRPQSKASVSDVNVGMDRENTSTPLPWAIQEESEYHTKKRSINEKPPRPPPPQHNVTQHHDGHNRHHRPNAHIMSPPPPYESHERRDSVEEIFTLDSGKRGEDTDYQTKKPPPRPAYNPNPTIRVISQTKGGGPVSGIDMARQAAQLLRIDETRPRPGQPGYKKPKRLVFVAE